MTVNTDIKNKNLTKLGKYVFFLEQCLYHPLNIQEAFQLLEPNLSETFAPLNVYIDDQLKDYTIYEQLEMENPTYLYHIVCDTSNSRFKKQLDIIKSYRNFVDCYQFQDENSNKAIIRCKVLLKARIKKLIDSKYSKIYKEEEHYSIERNKSFQNMYSYFDIEKGCVGFVDAWHVLTHSDEMYDKFKTRLNLSESMMLTPKGERIEFDSRYSISDETISYDS